MPSTTPIGFSSASIDVGRHVLVAGETAEAKQPLVGQQRGGGGAVPLEALEPHGPVLARRRARPPRVAVVGLVVRERVVDVAGHGLHLGVVEQVRRCAGTRPRRGTAPSPRRRRPVRTCAGDRAAHRRGRGSRPHPRCAPDGRRSATAARPTSRGSHRGRRGPSAADPRSTASSASRGRSRCRPARRPRAGRAPRRCRLGVMREPRLVGRKRPRARGDRDRERLELELGRAGRRQLRHGRPRAPAARPRRTPPRRQGGCRRRPGCGRRARPWTTRYVRRVGLSDSGDARARIRWCDRTDLAGVDPVVATGAGAAAGRTQRRC